MVIVRMRMVHVAIVVAVLGIVVMIVGVVVHPVHPLHFTRLRRIAPRARLVVRRMTETAKEHRQECLCYQWEV